MLKDKGKIETRSGGYEIAIPLEYAENAPSARYSGYDTQNIGSSNVLSAAKYDWCQSAIHVTASGRELRMNNGPEQMINLVKARIKNAMNTAANNMSVDLYSDGTLTNQIGGLANLIQNAGTGTVGGIVSSTYTFWKNKFSEMAGTNTWSKSTIKGEMNKLWLQLRPRQGQARPDPGLARHLLGVRGVAAGPPALQRYQQKRCCRLRVAEVQDGEHHLRQQHQLRHDLPRRLTSSTRTICTSSSIPRRSGPRTTRRSRRTRTRSLCPAVLDGCTGATTLAVADGVYPLGVMMSTLDATTKFGWLQIGGHCVGKCLTLFADLGIVYLTATPGSVDDASVIGDVVHLARGANGGTVAVGDLAGEFEIHRPYSENRVSLSN
jgi:hypothetical protein